jgi:uncharacterized membrane protein
VESKDLALTALFITLYSTLVIVQGISAAASIQIRFADALIPLSALFGSPVIFGVTVGCVISNIYLSASVPYGFIDVIFGPIANMVASALIFKMRRKPLIGCFLGALIVGLIVGSYVWLLFPPVESAILPPWLLSILVITMSSLFAIGGLGYSLIKALRKPNIARVLKAHGLKIYLEEADE